MKPNINRQYKPTFEQWRKIIKETEFSTDVHVSMIDLIDFNTSKIYIKGKKISFDCLNEDQYVWVCNGGYYEEAEPINDYNRI